MPLRPHPLHAIADAWKTLTVLALFVLAGVLSFRDAQGDDLASSYIGCRLIASQDADHLYSYDPTNFAAVGPDEPGNPWQDAADQGGFDGFLHPYVQTPLWAWSLQPLCTHTRFASFKSIFALLTMLAFAAFLWLVALFWAPNLARPAPLALLALGLFLAEPFRYAMRLMQTHILLMLLAVVALILAERRRPLLAGLCLALAAAVKITPAVLLLYWLITGRRRAAASMVLWSAALAALTLVTTGPEVMHAYLADLHRISNVLLLSQNNQSFAAWAMSFFYPPTEIALFHMLPLTPAIRLASAGLMVACTAAGGWIDRRTEARSEPPTHRGAAMGLLAATLFAPIAWTHYSFILLIPFVALAQRYRSQPSRFLLACLAVIAVLNFRPLATDVAEMHIGTLGIIRGQFFAGILSLIALGAVSWKHQRLLSSSAVTTEERISQHAA